MYNYKGFWIRDIIPAPPLVAPCLPFQREAGEGREGEGRGGEGHQVGEQGDVIVRKGKGDGCEGKCMSRGWREVGRRCRELTPPSIVV
jgi:hypothetical protein